MNVNGGSRERPGYDQRRIFSQICESNRASSAGRIEISLKRLSIGLSRQRRAVQQDKFKRPIGCRRGDGRRFPPECSERGFFQEREEECAKDRILLPQAQCLAEWDRRRIVENTKLLQPRVRLFELCFPHFGTPSPLRLLMHPCAPRPWLRLRRRRGRGW